MPKASDDTSSSATGAGQYHCQVTLLGRFQVTKGWKHHRYLQESEQDHCTILPKAERNFWKSEILKDTSGEAISLGAPSNCICFFILALSSAHSYVSQVLHSTLISLKLSSNKLAEILILCPKGVTLTSRAKIKFRCSLLHVGIQWF